MQRALLQDLVLGGLLSTIPYFSYCAKTTDNQLEGSNGKFPWWLSGIESD